MEIVRIQNEEALEDWLRAWSKKLRVGDWVALEGEMGVGKSTFVRRLLRVLGYPHPVPSPSYPILMEYPLEDFDLVHVDAYRLNGKEQDIFDIEDWKRKIVFVEWPERLALPSTAYRYWIRMKWGKTAEEREIEIQERPRDLSRTQG